MVSGAMGGQLQGRSGDGVPLRAGQCGCPSLPAPFAAGRPVQKVANGKSGREACARMIDEYGGRGRDSCGRAGDALKVVGGVGAKRPRTKNALEKPKIGHGSRF